MKNSIIKHCSFLLLLTSGLCYGAEFKIEPVYGFERTQKELPKPKKYRTTSYVGARVLWGVPRTAFEFEVNTSNAKDDFPEQNLEYKYQTNTALIGFRHYIAHGKNFGWFVRAGARAREERITEINNGVEDKKDPSINFGPYAGSGLTLAYGSLFALNASATVVYNKDADPSEQYDTRYGLSFTIKAGNR